MFTYANFPHTEGTFKARQNHAIHAITLNVRKLLAKRMRRQSTVLAFFVVHCQDFWSSHEDLVSYIPVVRVAISWLWISIHVVKIITCLLVLCQGKMVEWHICPDVFTQWGQERSILLTRSEKPYIFLRRPLVSHKSLSLLEDPLSSLSQPVLFLIKTCKQFASFCNLIR